MAVSPVGGGTATDQTGASPCAAGASVSIKAVASEGYHFVNWTAPAGSFDNASAAETAFTMPAQDVTVTANFAKYEYTLTVTPDGCCTIKVGGAEVTTSYTHDYTCGTEVSLEAVAGECCEFDEWKVDGVSQGAGVNPITVTMDANRSAVATCSVPMYDLTVTSDGCCPITVGELGTVAAGAAETFSDITCGTDVTLTADDSDACDFDNWVVDSGTPTTDNPITVTMDADHAAVAACTVPAPPTALVAEAGGPYGGTAGSPVNLSGSASGGTSPYTYDWDLDNDGTYETPGQDVSHTWASAGDYTVGLQVTDSASRANVATDTASVHITAPPPPPPGGVGGEAFPPNKLAILAPWLALAVAIIAGATILMRRRRAQE